MTVQSDILENYYPIDWSESTQSSKSHLIFPLQHRARQSVGAMEKLFLPFAGALYVYRPSKRRRILNRAVDKLEQSCLPGYEYVIAHLYDKYRRNLTISTVSQTGQTLHSFLLFLQEVRNTRVDNIFRKDIAAYVDHEQERGLMVNSIRNHLKTVYTFLKYLVDHELLPLDILYKKISIKAPEVLPRAIPTEDLKPILAGITSTRDRALILLLLHTGMRIGELLQVKMADIILSECKILLFIGAKNFHGRVVYYSREAEQALNKWLAERKRDSEYLFYGNKGQELSYVGAWMIMKKAIQKAGLEQRGYSLHSLRHTFATDMLNAGLRLEVLQQLLGHLDIELTLRYARISDTTREEAYFKAMTVIEKGENHEYDRINPELQAVFEEKELLRTDR